MDMAPKLRILHLIGCIAITLWTKTCKLTGSSVLPSLATCLGPISLWKAKSSPRYCRYIVPRRKIGTKWFATTFVGFDSCILLGVSWVFPCAHIRGSAKVEPPNSTKLRTPRHKAPAMLRLQPKGEKEQWREQMWLTYFYMIFPLKPPCLDDVPIKTSIYSWFSH